MKHVLKRREKTLVELQREFKEHAPRDLPPRNPELDRPIEDQKRLWKILTALGKALTSAWEKRKAL